MRRTTIFVMAGAMALGVAAPAMADYVRLGSVDVGYRADLDTAYSRFGGRLEGLRLTASRSDIYCRSVIVRFDNGETQNVFSGRLDERVPLDVDLRGRVRRVDNIRFVCRSDSYRGGKIYVAGDVGHYRDEWRRDRDWDSTWSAMLGGGGDWNRRDDGDHQDDHRGDWDRGGGPGEDWVSLGRQVFAGGDDRGTTSAGWAGRHVDHIALRPVEGDVRCNRVDARFDNGQSVTLDKNRRLQQGQMNTYDLPGNMRNLNSLYLRCHAIGNSRVTIEIYAHK